MPPKYCKVISWKVGYMESFMLNHDCAVFHIKHDVA